VGLHRRRAMLDLNYQEDVETDVDLNVVMTGSGRLIEVQGTGERNTFTRAELTRMVNLAARGIRQITGLQERSLKRRTGK
jgi:ribonuclease PH